MPERPSRPTLSTVAKAVGVSTATVSNAYNRPDQLSNDLRETILAAARDLGFDGPNPFGRSLRRGKIGAIGVVLTEALTYAFSDPAAIAFLEGVARSCEDSGTGITLLPAGSPSASRSRLIREAAVDGFVVYSVPSQDDLVGAVRSRRLPTVWIDQPDGGEDGFVGVDVVAGAELCATHLTSLGHRQVGVLSFPTDDSGFLEPAQTDAPETAHYEIVRARISGYRSAFESVGVTWETIPIQECPVSEADGYQAALTLLRGSPHITAIVAMCDVLALGAMRAANELGLAVPEDLSVVGFDGIPQGAVNSPRLTTLSQPLIEKGVVAGEMVLTRELRRVILDTELVVGTSTAKVPARTTSRP